MFIITSPIQTNRLILRPFTLDDLDDLHAIQSRPDVTRYLYWSPRGRAEVQAVLERKIEQTRLLADNDALCLAITLPRATTRAAVIGEISIWWRSVEHRQGEIGFVLHPNYQGRGFAAEAATAILDLGFNALRLHRVYGRTDARNTASAALMRRLGMRQEAHLIQNEWFKGAWSDEFLFAMLEDEWAARNAGRPRAGEVE